MNIVIEVMNLMTGDFVYYMNMSPEQAVICAFEQNKGNYNTWNYFNIPHKIKTGEKTIACGDFCAMKE